MALVAEEVTVRFGGVCAVDDVSLEVSPGEVTGLVGPNGAGKSTLFDVICGTRRPVRGRIKLAGHDMTGLAAHQRARLGISRTFQRLEFFESLTVRDNVRTAVEAAARLRSGPRSESSARIDPVERLLGEFGLAEVAGQLVSTVSTGTARLVELARAVAASPSVLLMDEPSAGLSTVEVATVADRMRVLAASGVAVLVVAHDMNLMTSVCDRVHVMHLGRIIASGTPAQISADPQVRTAYFGEPAGRLVESRDVPAAALPAAPKVLEICEVVAGYGGIPALDGVSLALSAGRVHALLGPNGAGKSTLVRVASGLLPPSRGQIRLCGRDIVVPAPHVLSRIGITTIPERPSVFGALTVAEHLRFGRGPAQQKTFERVFTTFPVLADRRDQLAGTLSGGEQQMLAVGRALASGPAILIVDELSNGLAPRIVSEVYGALREMARNGGAVLLVEQYVEQALAIADEVTLLRNGRVLFAGRAHLAAAELPRAYLGG